MEAPVVDLWSKADALRKAQAAPAAAAEDKSGDTTVAFIGAQGSGKSTLWSLFLGKQGASAFSVQPDTLLDYKIAKIPSATAPSGSATAHFWEVGGGRRLAPLLEHVLTPDNIASAHVFVVVDLSKPFYALEHAAFWIERIRARIHAVFGMLAEAKSPVPSRLVAATQARLASHPDRSSLKPLPVPVTIVGSKYDLILASAASSPDRVRIPVAYLRALAHRSGCGVICTSAAASTQSAAALKARAAGRVGTLATDALTAVAVAPGQDSLSALATAGVTGITSTDALLTSYKSAVQRVLVAGEDAEPAERALAAPALRAERRVEASRARARHEGGGARRRRRSSKGQQSGCGSCVARVTWRGATTHGCVSCCGDGGGTATAREAIACQRHGLAHTLKTCNLKKKIVSPEVGHGGSFKSISCVEATATGHACTHARAPESAAVNGTVY
jgi:hypothetical protein